VLYNPHFSDLGSWERFGPEVLKAFAGQDRYNLIVAPHVRLLDGKAATARWAGMLADHAAVPHIHIDRGSDRSIDMTWTTLADVYLGDVSSQVYEFLRTPRPCVFLNAGGVDWPADENYGHWRFGPVLDSTTDLVDAIDAARANHDGFVAAQVAGFAETFSTAEEPASERAARAIADFMQGRSE
jgi:CDP-glycerol glycerophosphotransferase (TagB/SpsB family)